MAQPSRSRSWLAWAAVAGLAALLLYGTIRTALHFAGKLRRHDRPQAGSLPPPAASWDPRCATEDMLFELLDLDDKAVPLSPRNQERARALLEEILARPAIEGNWMPRTDPEFYYDPGTLVFFCPGLRARHHDPALQEAAVTYWSPLQIFFLQSDRGSPPRVWSKAVRADPAMRERFAPLFTQALRDIPFFVGLLRDHRQSRDVRVRVAGLLGDAGVRARPAVPVLEATLRDPDGYVRAAAALALRTMDPGHRPALRALLELARDPDAGLRKNALSLLGTGSHRMRPLITGEAVVTAFAQALQDPDPRARYLAAAGLENLGRSAAPAAPALARALRDGERDVREQACAALRAIGPRAAAAVPALAESLLHDDNWRQRQEAGVALREIGRPAAAAVPALIRALDDPQDGVRDAAAQALAAMGGAAKASNAKLVEVLRHKDRHAWLAAAQAVSRMGPEGKAALPLLQDALEHDPDPDRRLAAAEAVLRLDPHNRAAIHRLCTYLGAADPSLDEDQRQRISYGARFSFKDLGPLAAGAVPCLVRLLRDRRCPTRHLVIEALGAIGPASGEAIPDAIEVLRDRSAANWKSAARALANMGPAARQAVPFLTEVVRAREEAGQRVAAAQALWRLDPSSKDLVPTLCDVIKHGKENSAACEEAAELLEQMGAAAEAALPALKEIQEDDHPTVRYTASSVLWTIQAHK